MCNPAAAMIAVTVVSGAMTAYGQHQQGQAAKAEGDYRAAIGRNNQIRANFLADDALTRGKEEKRKAALRGRLLIGQMRTALGANGVEVNTGSAADMQVDQAGVNSLDVFTAENNAEREAQEYMIKAQNFENEAMLSEFAGANAARAGKTAAAGTLLKTAGSVAGKWYQFDQAGAFDSPGSTKSGGYEATTGYYAQ